MPRMIRWLPEENLGLLSHHIALRPSGPSWGDVGFWHESYVVLAGGYEAVYGNMPRFRRAVAGEHMPVGAKASQWPTGPAPGAEPTRARLTGEFKTIVAIALDLE